MKNLFKNLAVLSMYSAMFFAVIKKALNTDTKKAIGISFILGFFAGLLNAIYVEVGDISRKLKNDSTKSDIS